MVNFRPAGRGVRSQPGPAGRIARSQPGPAGRHARACSCPTCHFFNPAGCEKLCCQGWLLPHLPYFSFWQGLKSFLPWDGSCHTCFILIPAGSEKLLALGWLLPHMPFSSIRQGLRSLLPWNGSCPTSLISLLGRGREANHPRNTPALPAIFSLPAGPEKLVAKE